MRWEELKLTKEDLKHRTIMSVTSIGKCAVCNEETHYIDYCTEQRICSEECMNEQDSAYIRAIRRQSGGC